MSSLRRSIGTARRVGLLNPATIAAAGAAALVWGPSSAAAYSAASVRSPTRIALIDDYGELTYLQLEVRANRVAAGFKAKGVKTGNTIGLLCRNHRGFVEANIGLAKLGARVVYLNPGLPASQLNEVIDREEITLVIADRDLSERVDHSNVVIAAPEDDPKWTFPGVSKWRPLLQMPHPTASDDPVVLTSGTTGAPKGTRRTASRATASAAFGVFDAIPFQRNDVVVLPAPLFHAWGLSQLLTAASLGGTVVLRRSFDPEQVAADVEAHGATALAVVPVMLHRILHADPPFDLSSLRVVASSGSALPGELAAQWIDRYGLNLYNLYGSTEVGQVSIATPADLAHDPATAGRPVRGVDVRLINDDGKEIVGPDQIGRIVVKSAMHFDGYTDGNTKEIFDGYMAIGDQGRFDADGRLYVLGRADDMIISGGENLFPSNIERALMKHPKVSDVAVVGVDDDDLGQRVRAVVVADGSSSSQTLITSIKKSITSDLASHEKPREYVFVDELPRNASGKILRRELTGSKASVPKLTKQRKKKRS